MSDKRVEKNPWQRDVEHFMTIAGQEVPSTLTLPATDFDTMVELHQASAQLQLIAERLKTHKGVAALRARLMVEEVAETVKALAAEDMVETADGLTDTLYVVIGTAAAYGIDLTPVWDAVHGANMAKFPTCSDCGGRGHGPGGPGAWRGPICPTCKGTGHVVIRDAGGKVQKPPGWAPADIGAVLQAQGWKGGPWEEP